MEKLQTGSFSLFFINGSLLDVIYFKGLRDENIYAEKRAIFDHRD